MEIYIYMLSRINILELFVRVQGRKLLFLCVFFLGGGVGFGFVFFLPKGVFSTNNIILWLSR